MRKGPVAKDLPAILAHMYRTSLKRQASLVDLKLFVIIINFYKQIASKTFPRLKEVDDVLGGAAAWENVDNTDGNHYIKYSNVYNVAMT